MAHKFQLHLDALIVIALLFALSLGANLYLWRENSALSKANVEANWERQNMEMNWNYMKVQLEQCRDVEN